MNLYFYAVKPLSILIAMLIVWGASGQELQGVVLNENQSPMPYVYVVNITKEVGSVSLGAALMMKTPLSADKEPTSSVMLTTYT